MNGRKVYAVDQNEIKGREDDKDMLSMFTFDYLFSTICKNNQNTALINTL